MTLTVCKIIEVSGDCFDLATYTLILLDVMRRFQEKQNQREARAMSNEVSEALSQAFAEIMKQEMKENETGHPGEHSTGDREERGVPADRNADWKPRMGQEPVGGVEDKEQGKGETGS